MTLNSIDPLELFLWTFRRNEKDVINLYDSLSDVMTLATGGDMINFGYWKADTTDPITAQKNLCGLFGEFAKLQSGEKILDVGCGYASPAVQWHDHYNPLEFFCVNINLKQLQDSQNNSEVIEKSKIQESKNGINLINATATKLPFENESVEKILAFESPQHFKPLVSFLAESKRILKKDGLLVLALPVMTDDSSTPLLKLGLLTMTWSSEHYASDFVLSLLKKEGFTLLEKKEIGNMVYSPLADYYSHHRDSIKQKILTKYPSYVENILYKSMQKMKKVSQKGIIEYLVLVCQKE